MTDLPRFGQYAATPRAEKCPRHPGVPAVGYCKRCNRPTCADCTIPTEVGSICVDCANPRRSMRSTLSLRQQPVVTLGILAVTVAVYLIGLVWPTIDNYLAFNPLIAAFEPWRFLTVALVHGGFFHLLFNMLMLYIIGGAVERAAGHWRFAMLYLLSALGGSLGVLAWGYIDPSSMAIWTVGASGALYGLFGAVFVEQRRAGISTTSILVLLGVNLVFSFMNAGAVSWQSHVGGLVVGALAAWMYTELAKPRPGTTARTQMWWSIGATVAAFAVLAAASWGFYLALGA